MSPRNKGGYKVRCKDCLRDVIKEILKRPETREQNRARRKQPKYREQARQHSKKRRKLYPELNQAGKRRHRARKYGSGGRHTLAEWRALLERCEHRCLRCGTTEDLSRDHVVPLTLGGTDNIDNIQPLCRSCNSKKSNRSCADYRKPA